MGKINLHHYSIKNQTPWMAFARQHYLMHQVIKQQETYATICEELAEMKTWLHKRYEVEADAEVQEVEQCCGDLRRMSLPRNSVDQCPGNKTLFVGSDKKGTCQLGIKICPASSESYPDRGNNLIRHWHWESKSLERKKYALSQDEGASLDMCIPSPKPIDKSKKAVEQVPMKKKSITVDENRVRDECRCWEEERREAEHQQQEEEALWKLNEMRQLDQEDQERMAKMKEMKERQEKARRDTTEAAWIKQAQEEAEVARAVESPTVG